MEALPEGSAEWTEPGLYSVAPGVHRIPLPLPNDGLKAVNVYALTEGDELVLIDSGWALAEAREQLADALKGLGAELGDVSQFLVTHVHRDHYTQAVALRREFGGRIALGSLEEQSLRMSADPGSAPMAGQIRLLRMCGADPVADELVRVFGIHGGNSEAAIWELPDEWLTPGRRSVLPGRALDVVHTPGHTAGHVVFDDGAAGLMFTGDHVLPHITPSIGFQPAVAEMPLRDFLDSLRLVRGMPDRRMLPAHGPVTDSVHARVDALLDHHAGRLDVIAATIADGAATAYESALRMGWTRRQRKLGEMDVFNQMLAVLETAAHLDLLVHQGKLALLVENGARRYSVA
ncbi:MBL fold metallo-hydrolase [Amycolatopsis endophytica]|uniref:Glyoxylase-like metal-dependent hydrolase (Beta-lactamase superfamily II) n=1 Tax=Amycolatopsis endophytica TaxID=860233 RepID=A0A853AWK4_9PSEU|nr:MBL fold metallo-hydrolase [Amycolatopsis endophytica]NYI87038.1 glyoxylase-like metal-dependent hydrolase (beta-lactamase superfamily II) [Amycolatopsis endophytica]